MSCVRLAQWIRKKLLLCIDTHIHTVRLVDAMRDHFLNVPYRLLLLFGHELAQSMAIRIEWNEERESERDKIKESTFAIIWPFTSHFVAWHFYCTNHIRHLLIENGKKIAHSKKAQFQNSQLDSFCLSLTTFQNYPIDDTQLIPTVLNWFTTLFMPYHPPCLQYFHYLCSGCCCCFIFACTFSLSLNISLILVRGMFIVWYVLDCVRTSVHP